ncbi:MAG: Calx-beta domain-containing protein [Cyanobacteria bacterium J06638_20]
MTFPAQFNLSDLNGSNGFVLNGIDEYDYSGRSVSGAGDINGDGIDDLIIGATGADPNGISIAGESYVVFGSNQGFATNLELSDLDGRNGFVLNGIDERDNSGVRVSGAGDINGDGIDDLIIGAFFASPNGRYDAGESYVVFGRNQGFATRLNLANLDGLNGFVLNGIDEGDLSGLSVSEAGDVNGDGIDDLIIGANGADPNGRNDAGESYVVFGSNQGFAASLDLSDLDGRNGFAINGFARFSFFGRSVSGAGDINGDGFDDLIIGAALVDSSSGESYVVFGSDQGFAASLNLSDLDGRNAFVLEGIGDYDNSGLSVSGAGDVNGDGFDDLIIGAPSTNPNDDRFGESYVVFGSDQGFANRVNLSILDGSNGFAIDGIDIGDSSGVSVSGAGDINGDGFDDLIIGADRANPNGNNSGESYVVFGSNQGFASRLNLADLDGNNGFVLNGIDAEDLSGRSVSGAGDINGDGIDDLIIGAVGADPNSNSYAGESYVVFGQAPLTISIAATDEQATEAGIGTATFTVTRVGDTNTTALTVPYRIAARSTATNGADFVALSGTVTIPAGRASANIVLTPIDDSISEGPETVVLQLVDTADYRLNATAFQASITIADDDPTSRDDVLAGSDRRDVIFAQAGNDRVRGRDGNDRLAGQAGNDQLLGGAGRDDLLGGSGTDSLTGGAGNDRLLGSTSNDRITGNVGNDRLVGGAGADNLLGGADNDRLFGGAGNDTLSGGDSNDQLRGSRGNDLLKGGAGNDRMLGGTGNDTLNGQAGDDALRGGAGNDVLRGGSGNDRLAGELGNDLIVTGTGRDRIVIRPGQGFDRVTDFTDGQDRIVLGGITFGQLSIQQRNNDVLISRGTERLLLLQNTNVGDISAADFV